MLYLIHGTDQTTSRKKLHTLVEGLLKKKPNASEFWFDGDFLADSEIDSLIQSSGLFENKYIVVFDKVLENKEHQDSLPKKFKEISNSENIFIFLEGELTKKILSRFEKWSAKIQKFDLGVEPKEEKFNMFALTDALGKRDRKNLWVLYRKALNSGALPQDVHGILLWQIKNLLMVKTTSNVRGLGLNPFVLRKALSFMKNYSEEELKKLSMSLIVMHHDTRRGIVELNNSLERFLLSV